MLTEQQQRVLDEVQQQRYMIHQVPGRLMNHLLMVYGQPTEQQRLLLEQVTQDWNNKYKLNL
jgi:hypothetical protein